MSWEDEQEIAERYLHSMFSDEVVAEVGSELIPDQPEAED
jgi:hypothetical protein